MKDTGSRFVAAPLSGWASCSANCSDVAGSGSPKGAPGSAAALPQTEDDDVPDEAPSSRGRSAVRASSSPNEVASIGALAETFSLHGFSPSTAAPDSDVFNHASDVSSTPAFSAETSALMDCQTLATFVGRSHAASPADHWDSAGRSQATCDAVPACSATNPLAASSAALAASSSAAANFNSSS